MAIKSFTQKQPPDIKTDDDLVAPRASIVALRGDASQKAVKAWATVTRGKETIARRHDLRENKMDLAMMCRSGHAQTKENTFIDNRGTRVCRECRKDNLIRFRAKLKKGRPAQPRSIDKTHCPHGHPLVEGNLMKRKDPRRQWRECRTCNRGDRPIKPEKLKLITKKVVTGLENGATLTSLGGRTRNQYVGGFIIRPKQIRFICEAFPALETKISSLAKKNMRNVAATVAARRHPEKNILPLIDAAVARNIPDFMQDEIRQELALMLYEGTLQLSNIDQAAKRLLSRQYRDYDLSSRFGHRSLDAVIYDDGDVRLIDTISRGLW